MLLERYRTCKIQLVYEAGCFGFWLHDLLVEQEEKLTGFVGNWLFRRRNVRHVRPDNHPCEEGDGKDKLNDDDEPRVILQPGERRNVIRDA